MSNNNENGYLSRAACEKFQAWGIENPNKTLDPNIRNWFTRVNPESALFMQGLHAALFDRNPAVFTQKIIEIMRVEAENLYSKIKSTRDPELKARLSAELHNIARDLSEMPCQKSMGQDWEQFTYDQVQF